MDVGEGAGSEGQGDVRDAKAPDAQWVAPDSGHRDCAEICREDVVENGEVMGRQVPDHVHVLLEEAEVSSHRVEIEDVADVAAAHKLTELGDRRCIAKSVITDEEPVDARGEFCQANALGQRGGERLLDDDVSPRQQAFAGEARVSGDGRRNGHKRYTRIGEYLMDRGCGGYGAVGCGNAGGTVAIQVTDPKKVDGRMHSDVADKVRSPVTRTQNGSTDFGHLLSLNPRRDRIGHGRA